MMFDWPASDPAYRALLQGLPAPMRTSTPPTADESRSFKRYGAWQRRNQKFAFPESELRNTFVTNPDRTKGRSKTPQRIHTAIGTGQKTRGYSHIRVPVLAFLELPRLEKLPSEYQPQNEAERAAIQAFDSATAAYGDRWLDNLERGVPTARIVDLPGAGHYVFLTRKAEVLDALREFVASL